MRLERGVLQRPCRRARLAHLDPDAGRSGRLRHLRCNPEHRRPLLCLFPVHLRLLLSQRRSLQLGFIDLEPISREEIGRGGAHQSPLAARQYLESVFLSTARRDALSFGNVADDGVRVSERRDGVCDEVVFEERE